MALIAPGAQADGVAPTIHLLRLVSGEAYTLALPARAARESAAPLVVSLHYGGPVSAHYGRALLEDIVEPALRALGAVMVAPDCARRAWTDCEETVLRVIEHVTATHGIDRKRIVLTGYSKGGIGTWDLAARHAPLFSAAIVMAGRPGAHIIESEWDLPMRAIQANADEVFPSAPTLKLIARLQARGVDASVQLLDGVTHYDTHRFVEPLRRLVPWILERWEPKNTS